MFEIFQYDFMVRAFVAGIVVAIVAPVIGVFLVVRRFSLIADTLAHVSLVGIAMGMLLKIDPLLTALLTSVLASIGIEKIRKSKKVFEESILALFLSGSLALALVIISFTKGFNANLFSYLFGSITTVTTSDIFIISGFGIVACIAIWVLFKEFFLLALDEELAKTQGLPTEILNTILIAIAAISISLSMRIVGILLTGALMVIPVMTAMQWAKSFRLIVFYSIVFSLGAVTSGLLVSYYLNLTSGGTIVLIALVFFLFSFGIHKQ